MSLVVSITVKVVTTIVFAIPCMENAQSGIEGELVISGQLFLIDTVIAACICDGWGARFPIHPVIVSCYGDRTA
jgi:hypothetical protein